MFGDGVTIVKPSSWCYNVVGKTLVLKACQNTGMITWTEKQSGKVLCQVQNTDICTGSWRFFVSLLWSGTRIKLVPETEVDKAARLAPLKEKLRQAEIKAD